MRQVSPQLIEIVGRLPEPMRTIGSGRTTGCAAWTARNCAIRGLLRRILERSLSARRALQQRRYGQIVRPNVDISQIRINRGFCKTDRRRCWTLYDPAITYEFPGGLAPHSVCKCWDQSATLLESASHADVDVDFVGGAGVERTVNGSRGHQERRLHVASLQGGPRSEHPRCHRGRVHRHRGHIVLRQPRSRRRIEVLPPQPGFTGTVVGQGHRLHRNPPRADAGRFSIARADGHARCVAVPGGETRRRRWRAIPRTRPGPKRA